MKIIWDLPLYNHTRFLESLRPVPHSELVLIGRYIGLYRQPWEFQQRLDDVVFLLLLSRPELNNRSKSSFSSHQAQQDHCFPIHIGQAYDQEYEELQQVLENWNDLGDQPFEEEFS